MTGTGGLRIRDARLVWGERTYVMGIVNVTPDSFSGDGLLASGTEGDPVAAAVGLGVRMVADGADLLDVGAESTRPGHVAVDAAEELRRVVPVIEALRAALPGTPISIDTTKPEVALAALDAGADLLNDVRGTRGGGALDTVAATRGVPLILMHGREQADHVDVVPEVRAELSAATVRARAAGVPAEHLIVDPGIGFGKTPDDNLALLRDLAALRDLGYPILLGTSRKSTLGRVLDLPPAERVETTIATTALAIAAGVDIVRVHDVQANVRAARMSDAIVRGWRPTGWEGPQR